MKSSERIYASDLATIIGKTLKTAQRMLLDLENEHGALVVQRDGRERYTNWDALEQVTDFRRPEEGLTLNVGKLLSTMRRLLANDVARAEAVDALDERVERIELALRSDRAHAK